MKKILLMSDTHSYMDDDILVHAREADEIWHAGDLGNVALVDTLESCTKTIGVFGNIDDKDVKLCWPLNQVFTCEGVKVVITHIGGYPGRYNRRTKELLLQEKPDLYICGHSHITKVMRDTNLNLLHMNPGACGNIGFHKFRTMLRFRCDNGKIEQLEMIELGARG